jgi:hypothetical protein
MMFFTNASNSGGVDVPGWLSRSTSGLTNETAGSKPALASAKNAGRSCKLLLSTRLVMIELEN